jgi:hypothetical protein
MLRNVFAIVLLAALGVHGTLTNAENRALLIGASGYPSHIGPLLGPSNDVQVIWGLLTGRGFKAENVRVLADSLQDNFAKMASVNCARTDGPACPVYFNIMHALADLVAKTQRGDYVVLYFSGHGTQIPDLIKRDEPDGLTEGFVPLDVGRWDDKQRTVLNLVTDDTIGDAIEKIRAKGAFVWAIIDTCHAGDMVRGATSYGVPRLVRGSVLGIPDKAFEDARKPGSPHKGSSLNLLKIGRSDGLVGFYAAQSDQLALELGFEKRDASGKSTQVVMGALTNALRRALAQEPNATYRQLAQRIVEIYGNLGADMPSPYFEGDLDKSVFSDTAMDPVWPAKWQLGRLSVTAGELDGLHEGAILALIGAESTGPSAPAIGYARIERAAMSQSEAVPITYADKKPLVASPTPTLRARLERPGIRAVLRVALPPQTDAADLGADRSGRAVLDSFRHALVERSGLSVEWVEAGQPADVHLRLADGRIWMLTAFGEWVHTGPRQSPSIAVAETKVTANALQENLWRASRALNLQRLAGGYRQSLRGFVPAVTKGLKVDLFLYRDPKANGGSNCPEPPGAQNLPADAVRISADMSPEFRHCDVIYVVMRNTGQRPVDVTLLYIEAEAQIDCFNSWGKARIDPGEVRDRIQGIRIVTMDRDSKPLPIGRERLVVIGVEKASRDAIETTFCHLAQASLDSARGAGRRGSSNAFSALVEESGLAATPTRGFTAVGPEELRDVVMQTFAWDVKEQRK